MVCSNRLDFCAYAWSATRRRRATSRSLTCSCDTQKPKWTPISARVVCWARFVVAAGSRAASSRAGAPGEREPLSWLHEKRNAGNRQGNVNASDWCCENGRTWCGVVGFLPHILDERERASRALARRRLECILMRGALIGLALAWRRSAAALLRGSLGQVAETGLCRAELLTCIAHSEGMLIRRPPIIRCLQGGTGSRLAGLL